MARRGWTRPRDVQAQVIPAIRQGRDVIALAETGSGKTLAFLAPVLQHILDDRPPSGGRFEPSQRLRGLVVCPTRELAEQTAAVATDLVSGTVLRAGAVVGSVSITPQIEMIGEGLDLLVGTPGRLQELLDAGALGFESLLFVVIDEADRMFDMGFAPQITRLAAAMPTGRRTLLFTATMPRDVERLAAEHLDRPLRIETHPHTVAAAHVTQHVVVVHPSDRIDLLRHLHDQDAGRMLVFCRTRRRVGWVAAALGRHGVRVAQLHADRSQAQRRRALEAFAAGDLDILVCTDVGSRGLHIPGVRTVVNYDVPSTAEDLVHRAGRAAHGHRGQGDAWTLLGERELDAWYDLAPAAGVNAHPESVPGFEGSHESRRQRSTSNRRPRSSKRTPGPGRRKRASRPIDPDQKPGRGVIRPE